MRRAFVLLAAVIGAGCSLMGLDEVQATACASASERDLRDAHALCARELRDIPLGSCEAPVCAAQVGAELFCVVGTPDEDGDGVGDGACIAEGSELPRDCDDDDPTVAEGLAEVCDGKDNDCDGRVDESLLVAGAPTRRDVAHDPSSPADTEGLVATAAAGETVEAAFRRSGRLHLLQGSAPFKPQVASVGDVRLDDPATEATDRGLALASDGTSTFVVFPAAGCDRLSAGTVTGTTLASASFAPPEGTEPTGLPSATGTACTDPAMQRAPVVSLDGTDVVIAWLESAARGVCGGGQRAPLVATTSDMTAALTAGVLDLGMANDAGPPATLYLPSAGVHVIAYGDGSDIVVRSLRRRGSDLEIVSTARVDAGMSVQEIALAVGPTNDTEAIVGVAASVGCGSRARVLLQRVSVGRGDGEISPAGDFDVVDEGGEQRRPAVAYGANRPRGFFVVWAEDDMRLRGQLLDAASGTSGSAFDVMGPADFEGMVPSRLRGIGVATIAAGGFETMAHVRHETPGFYATTVLCGGE